MTAGTTRRQNSASSPADGTCPSAVTVPPWTRRPAARTTTVPAGVPDSEDSSCRIAAAAEGRQDCI